MHFIAKKPNATFKLALFMEKLPLLLIFGKPVLKVERRINPGKVQWNHENTKQQMFTAKYYFSYSAYFENLQGTLWPTLQADQRLEMNAIVHVYDQHTSYFKLYFEMYTSFQFVFRPTMILPIRYATVTILPQYITQNYQTTYLSASHQLYTLPGHKDGQNVPKQLQGKNSMFIFKGGVQ